MKSYIAALLLANSLFLFGACTEKKSYKDTSLPPAERAELLLKEMTLEEKIGQMCQYVGPSHVEANEKKQNQSSNDMNNIDANAFGMKGQSIIDKVRQGQIGAFLHVLTVEEANMLQKAAQETRLKIPLLFGVDAIHGNGLHAGCTVYPTSITMASTFNPDLMEQSGTETASEMRASGMHWAFNPNIEVARDPRWGRIGETFGEDPYLVTQMGTRLIQGLQGRDGVQPDRVLACAKHMIAGSEPAGGINAAPMDLSEQKLREVFLPPFAAAIQAHIYTVMAAHNELNGIPCHANHWLLKDLLREELGFDGFVVSDWMDIERLHSMHHFVPNEEEAFCVSVEAGIDMHMQGDHYFETILKAVQTGRIPETRIDAAVRKILEAKFLLGLFENPLVDITATRSLIAPAAHRVRPFQHELVVRQHLPVRLLQRVRLQHVGPVPPAALALRPAIGGQGLGRLPVQVQRRHPRAGLGKGPGHLAAQNARRAGDHHDLAAEIHIQWQLHFKTAPFSRAIHGAARFAFSQASNSPLIYAAPSARSYRP